MLFSSDTACLSVVYCYFLCFEKYLFFRRSQTNAVQHPINKLLSPPSLNISLSFISNFVSALQNCGFTVFAVRRLGRPKESLILQSWCFEGCFGVPWLEIGFVFYFFLFFAMLFAIIARACSLRTLLSLKPLGNAENGFCLAMAN